MSYLSLIPLGNVVAISVARPGIFMSKKGYEFWGRKGKEEQMKRE